MCKIYKIANSASTNTQLIYNTLIVNDQQIPLSSCQGAASDLSSHRLM